MSAWSRGNRVFLKLRVPGLIGEGVRVAKSKRGRLSTAFVAWLWVQKWLKRLVKLYISVSIHGNFDEPYLYMSSRAGQTLVLNFHISAKTNTGREEESLLIA